MYDPATHVRHPNWCYCASCGEWFTSDSGFDAHLGPIPKSGRPKCKHPSEVRSGSRRLIYDDARNVWRWDGERPVSVYEAA
jgi:hypothetical protein